MTSVMIPLNPPRRGSGAHNVVDRRAAGAALSVEVRRWNDDDPGFEYMVSVNGRAGTIWGVDFGRADVVGFGRMLAEALETGSGRFDLAYCAAGPATPRNAVDRKGAFFANTIEAHEDADAHYVLAVFARSSTTWYPSCTVTFDRNAFHAFAEEIFRLA